jgi:protein MpaA
MARSIFKRGTIAQEPDVYGHSVEQTPLHIWHPSCSKVEVLIFAGIHGEEPDTTVLLSRALRSMNFRSTSCAVILCANPDGSRHGTRGNSNGVDLNRNFPSSNWTVKPATHKWNFDCDSRVRLSPGTQPCSEPEVAALTEVVKDLKPECIVSMHSPLGLIDDPQRTDLGHMFSERSGMPRTVLPNENTPGSFGSWANDIGVATITYELPNLTVWDMFPIHLPIIQDVLEKGLDAVQTRTQSAKSAREATLQLAE